MRLDTVAIVPAGGAARRLGRRAGAGKAALAAGGLTFLDRVCTTLAAEVGRVIVVAGPTTVVPAVRVPVDVIRDSRQGAGPLAAVRDGLAHAAASAPPPRLAVLCSCDVPLLVPAVVGVLLERADGPDVRWVLPSVDGHPQPLVSVIAVDLLPEIENHLAHGNASLRDLAAAIERRWPGAVCRVNADDLRGVDPALDSFCDVDTPADLEAVARRASQPPHRA